MRRRSHERDRRERQAGALPRSELSVPESIERTAER